MRRSQCAREQRPTRLGLAEGTALPPLPPDRLIFIVFAPVIVSIFTQEVGPAYYAVQCLRIVSLGFPFYAYGMVLTQSFNGAGDTWTPTYINLFCFWLFELPAAYVMAYVLGWGPQGVFIALTVAFSSLAVVSAIIFRRGRWKTQKV